MTKRVEIETVFVIINWIRVDYYPGGKQIRVKVIADRETER